MCLYVCKRCVRDAVCVRTVRVCLYTIYCMYVFVRMFCPCVCLCLRCVCVVCVPVLCVCCVCRVGTVRVCAVCVCVVCVTFARYLTSIEMPVLTCTVKRYKQKKQKTVYKNSEKDENK